MRSTRIAGALALLVAGCGDDDDAATTTTFSPGSAPVPSRRRRSACRIGAIGPRQIGVWMLDCPE
ncbi:MAG: hypothetical protein U5K30_13555 [Acidimicrobiales bacterium]|nr:hypothetical protein [Acidimicrobiales bacterium]